MKKRLMSILLVFAMAVSVVSNAAVSQAKTKTVTKNVGDGLPEEVEGASDAAEKFAEAASKFVEDMGDLSTLAKGITVGGGLTLAVSGCISILKMCGVIEDPTEKKLSRIIDGVNDIENQLVIMDRELNDIKNQIASLDVSTTEKKRASDAIAYLGQWNLFKDQFLNELAQRRAKYEGMIENGVEAWWKSDTHDAVAVAFTKIDGNDVQVIASDAKTELPDKADNGTTIDKSESFIVPADVMPATKAEKYDPNKYVSDYQKIASASIIKAANDKKLIASEDFYKTWDAMSDADKKAKADQYGDCILTAAVYNISCDVMSSAEGHDFTKQFIEFYKSFAGDLVSGTDGAILLIDAYMNMYCFEGEAKDKINYVIDSMIVDAGLYGQLALNVAAQDYKIKDDVKKDLQKVWINTINSLEKIRKASLTGDDGYCYPASSCLKYDTATVKSEMRMWWTYQWNLIKDKYRYEDRWWNAWYTVDKDGNEFKLEEAPVINDVNTKILYDNYVIRNAQAKEEDKTDFAGYLNKFGVGMPEGFSGNILTSYLGQDGFSLGSKLKMTAHNVTGDYFKDNEEYAVFDGSGDASSSYFCLYDNVSYGYVNASSGEINKEARLCARAMYTESHDKWSVDEMAAFHKDCDCDVEQKNAGTKSGRKQYKKLFYLSKGVSYLRATAPIPSNENQGNTDSEAGAIKHYEKHGVKIAINGNAKLKKKSLEYNGKSQKPVVKTIDGNTVVEGRDYTIKVNKTAKKIGSYKATIKGKGHYQGTQTLSFKIVKANNGLSAKGKYVDLKASKLKKKAQTVKVSKLATVKGAKGKVTYSIAKVDNMKQKKSFTINKKTGALKIKKGLKKGEYFVYLKVKAAGNKTTKSKTEEVRVIVTVE